MSAFTDRPSTSQYSSVFVLYRFYGADDALLYIGQTRNPAKRLEKHAGDKSWWSDVTRIEFQHFNDLAELREAERQAISTEKPVHNIRMNGGASKTPKARTPDPLEEVAIDGLVGRFFHTFRPYDPSDPDDELATVVNGRAVVWQGRVLEEINPDLFAIETYSWWDGSATGNQLARIDGMLDWRFYDNALEMQVALPCGERHDSGRYCRGERAYYTRSPGFLHFICDSCRDYYPGFADYTPLIWRNGKPHFK